MRRFEVYASVLFALVWLATILLWIDAPDAGRFPAPSLLFPFAAALGWIAGNFFASRIKSEAFSRRRLLALYLTGPPALIWFFWAFAPREVQAAAPLVPLLSLGIYGLFFLVPVTIRRR